METEDATPNHHARYPAFAGATGLVAALSMLAGRGDAARLALELSGATVGDLVVDVGCGPGVAARAAARRGIRVVGVDPAAVMLRVARACTRDGAVRYVEGRAEALPLADGEATVLWSIATVHHWSDIDAGLREARRVLRAGGRLVAIERLAEPGARGHGSHGWTPARAEAFAARCEEHGLAGARVARHPGGRRALISVVAT